MLTAAMILAVGPITHAAPPPSVEGTRTVQLAQENIYFVFGSPYGPHIQETRIKMLVAAEQDHDWVLVKCDYRIRGYIQNAELCFGTWELATSNPIAAAEVARQLLDDETYCIKVEAKSGVVPQKRFDSCMKRITYRRAEAKVNGWEIIIDYDLFMENTNQVDNKICSLYVLRKMTEDSTIDEIRSKHMLKKCLEEMLHLRDEAKEHPPEGWKL